MGARNHREPFHCGVRRGRGYTHGASPEGLGLTPHPTVLHHMFPHREPPALVSSPVKRGPGIFLSSWL